MRTVAFIIPPTVELLDFAGPVQVFTEAKVQGMELDIKFYTYRENPISTAGLCFEQLKYFVQATLKEGHYVFVPGMDNDYVNSISFIDEAVPINSKVFTWIIVITLIRKYMKYRIISSKTLQKKLIWTRWPQW